MNGTKVLLVVSRNRTGTQTSYEHEEHLLCLSFTEHWNKLSRQAVESPPLEEVLQYLSGCFPGQPTVD